MTYYQKDIRDIQKKNKQSPIIEQIIRLCQEKIKDQKDREKGTTYGLDDYNDGRIVGSAALARKILSLLGVSFY